MATIQLNPKLHELVHMMKKVELQSIDKLSINELSASESAAVKKSFTDVRTSQLVGVQSSWT
ncbi:hypothetical protein BC351_29830 [Paenibacillus ferrarius]|uniref:Uncharacterized protein n=1 Tax=Paenibacillus ferrarius TaxID=1469647 RepID=A0A1V4HH78_9BACL|nr:hypothetical protein [Paenibacillus ferrarius]OPH54927.1 hypothetical protein BC351_29830 [Paenibacillus ferrarius]